MQTIFQNIILIIIGLSSGYIVAGGVVAFISIIGIIPIMAYRTKTSHYMMWYENMIIIGSIIGSIFYCWEFRILVPPILMSVFAFAHGIFIGVLIIALAEVLDVLPIMNRRVKIRKGISFIVIALALGKLVGSLCYWIYPYFTEVYLS
ncbi:MAG: stage V sporulation protein AB [Cellulosilyticum sp.]|nr:stage V sporulation protein AB [Cellulosilyticum sp.]